MFSLGGRGALMYAKSEELRNDIENRVRGC